MAKTVHLRAQDGLYVSAENGGGSTVDVIRPLAGAWESFTMYTPDGWPVPDGGVVVFEVDQTQYLSADNGGGGPVVAKYKPASTWETFRIHRTEGVGPIDATTRVALSAYNGQYACAEGGGGGVLNANRQAIGPWETFTLEVVGDAPIRAHAGPDAVGEGEQHAETWVQFGPDGKAYWRTQTWTEIGWRGFHGGVAVFLLDLAQNIVGMLPYKNYGVNGSWVSGAGRTDLEQADMDAGLYQKTVSLQIAHVLDPRSLIGEWLNQHLSQLTLQNVFSVIAEMVKHA